MTVDSAMLPGSVTNRFKCKVFRIDDGGRHLIAARKITEAYRIAAEHAGYSDVDDYILDCEPIFHEVDEDQEITINLAESMPVPRVTRDDLDQVESWPERIKIEVTMVAKGYARDWMLRDWTGLIGTTEY